MNKHAEVLVIGGGIVGTSCTYFLAKAGINVILLEKNRLGQHASGTNFGNIRRQGRPMTQLAMAARANNFWRSAKEVVGVDLEFRPVGHIRIAYKNNKGAEAAFVNYAEQAKEYDLDLEILSKADLKKRYPFFSDEVEVGSLSPADGHANPRLVSPAFGRAAQFHGAEIIEDTAVHKIETYGSGFIVHCSNSIAIRAEKLVIASGVWSSGLTSEFGESVSLTSFGPTMSVTEPCTYAIAPSVGVYTSNEYESIYFRQIERGNIIIGGSYRSIGQPSTGHTKVRPENVLSQWQQIHRLAPEIAKLNVIRTWTGTEGYTPDGQPIIGPSKTTPNLFYGFGFSGAGFQIGPGVGETLAELITEGKTTIDLAPFSIGRFTTN